MTSIVRVVRADEVGPAAPAPVAASEIADAHARIDMTIDQMRATSVRVREDLRLTRKRGTRTQIACVDQALSRSDVAVRRARETGEALLTAYARGDSTLARALLRRLEEIREWQRLAAFEGASCTPTVALARTTGGAGRAEETTTVKLQIDPNVAPAP